MASTINGLVAFITGAASGLGRGTLLHLLRNGAKGVCCFDKQAFKVTSGEEMPPNGEDRLVSIQGDVRNENNVANAFASCFKKFGKIDLIVNCAAVTTAFFTYNPSNNKIYNLRDFQQVNEINIIGNFNVIRLGVGYLAKNDADEVNKLRGLIITTSGIHSSHSTKFLVKKSVKAMIVCEIFIVSWFIMIFYCFLVSFSQKSQLKYVFFAHIQSF